MKKELVVAGIGAVALASTASAQLWDNGPVITHTGTHPTGADVSLLQNDSLGLTTLGANVSPDTFSIADNFTVGDEPGWFIDSIDFYAYQTGSGLESTLTDVYVQIWDGSPADSGSSVVWGDLATNLISDTDWTGAYRVSETNFDSEARPLMSITADTSGLSLDEGEYWVEVSIDGSESSGPWMPPVTIIGETDTGDAVRHTSSGWEDWLDGGAETPQGMPFVMHGSVIPAPGAIALLGLAGLVGSRRRRS